MNKVLPFSDFIKLNEDDLRDRQAKGPYRLLYPPQHHSASGNALPSAQNLPGWKEVADKEGITIASPTGAELLSPAKDKNDDCKPKGPNVGPSAELKPYKS